LLSWGIILRDGRSSQHNVSAAIGMLLFLGMVFLNAFAFTYPYTLPAMREKGWLVYLLASLFLGAGVLTAQVPVVISERRIRFQAAEVGLGVGLLISLGLVAAFVWPQPAKPLEEDRPLILSTYNIHYGYDEPWHLSLEAQAETIREAGVDVVALQEVDTGRITSYAVDGAYFLGRTLGMNVAYLPTVEHLTGIAVLYKGPKAPERVGLLTSLEEQTGIVGVALDVNVSADTYGIWVGLEAEDTMRQVGEAIEFIGDRSVVSWGGDFNAEPESGEVQAIMEAGFIDPFIVLGIDPPPNTSPAINPEKRIDFVFLRGMIPVAAYVSESLASDHRMVVVEAELFR
jgi:endonuclease/exonuclease/phosphatase family metal-dependent hydrolase